MSEPFLGEIRMVGFHFAPSGWAMCNGQLLAVSQNEALFSLLGTIYGGDGRTTFALPDLRGRTPVQQGTGPGLSSRVIGQRLGTENEMLSINEMPAHNHGWPASNVDGDLFTPVNNFYSKEDVNQTPLNAYSTAGNQVAFASDMCIDAGGSQSHINEMPFLVVNFIIALVGLYPSRT